MKTIIIIICCFILLILISSVSYLLFRKIYTEPVSCSGIMKYIRVKTRTSEYKIRRNKTIIPIGIFDKTYAGIEIVYFGKVYTVECKIYDVEKMLLNVNEVVNIKGYKFKNKEKFKIKYCT